MSKKCKQALWPLALYCDAQCARLVGRPCPALACTAALLVQRLFVRWYAQSFSIVLVLPPPPSSTDSHPVGLLGPNPLGEVRRPEVAEGGRRRPGALIPTAARVGQP